jgi:hypothetical protein
MSDKNLVNTVILGDNVDVTDIDQGALGDCYFLSACSAVAEKPERFVQAILTDSINPAGLFAMHAYVRGVPGLMVIDDYLPFQVYSWGAAYPLFTQQSNQGEIWGMLMEKVWAKLNGNYE